MTQPLAIVTIWAMRALALMSVFAVMPCFSAKARLGETPYQCQQRYQQMLKKVAAYVPGSDPEAEIFRKEAVDITVHYKNGRAWHLAFIKLGMTEADRSVYLQANAGEAGWPEPRGERIISQTYWISQKGRRAAVFYSMGREGLMEVLTAECVEAMAQAREQRLRAAVRDAVGLRSRSAAAPIQAPATKEPSSSEANPAQPKEDPLKGF